MGGERIVERMMEAGATAVTHKLEQSNDTQNRLHAVEQNLSDDAFIKLRSQEADQRIRGMKIIGFTLVGALAAAGGGVAWSIHEVADAGIRAHDAVKKDASDTVHAIGKALNSLKDDVQHPSLAFNAEAVVSKISLSGTMPLVEVTGTSDFGTDVRQESSVPVLGWVYNHVLSGSTNIDNMAHRAGKLTIGINGNAIKELLVVDPSTASGYHLELDVDASKLTVDKNMHYVTMTNKDGTVTEGLENSTGSLSDGEKRLAQYDAAVTEAADNGLQNKCSEVALPALPSAVAYAVKENIYRNIIGILQQANKKSLEPSIDLLQDLATGPIKVVFTEPQQLPGAAYGVKEPVKVNVDAINLPQAPGLDKDSLAKIMQVAPEHLHPTASVGCKVSVDAEKQLVDIVRQVNAN